MAPATVHRRLEGKPLRPASAERIERAAKKLGIVLPRLAVLPGWGSTDVADLTPTDASAPARPPTP